MERLCLAFCSLFWMLERMLAARRAAPNIYPFQSSHSEPIDNTSSSMDQMISNPTRYDVIISRPDGKIRNTMILSGKTAAELGILSLHPR